MTAVNKRKQGNEAVIRKLKLTTAFPWILELFSCHGRLNEYKFIITASQDNEFFDLKPLSRSKKFRNLSVANKEMKAPGC